MGKLKLVKYDGVSYLGDKEIEIRGRPIIVSFPANQTEELEESVAIFDFVEDPE